MDLPIRDKTRDDRAREAFAGGLGLIVNRIARAVRRVAVASADGDKANVAVVCVGFLRYGSAQALGLRETGLDVTLYYVDRRAEFAESAKDREALRSHAATGGVELVPIPRFRARTVIKDTLWLCRDMRRRKIATAVVQSHKDLRVALLGLAMPTALMLHDPQPHSGDTFSAVASRSLLPARLSELTSACLILHSARLFEQLRPQLRRLPRGVVPHGAEMAKAPSAVPGERRLLVFGRLFAYKGVDTALDAFRMLSSEMPDVTLIVAGRGPLADLAQGQRGVEVRDEYIADSEVDALLSGVRLVLLPYKDATQSGVGLQAVARGVPCIVSSVGALPDLVPDAHSTLIVPPEDPQRLAAAIAANIDHDERLRQSVYDYAASNFAWRVVAQELRNEVGRLVPS